MWKIIQQLCEDIRGNLTVYEAVDNCFVVITVS